MSKRGERILIVAGEPSGDRHAAELIKAYRELRPESRFYGIGGDEMQAEGVELLFHLRQMAFLGLVEVVKHLPFIRKVFRTLLQWMKSEQPAAVILVDYPGFNLRLARLAKRLGIPVVYYICPQLWAWGERRVAKIKKYVDLPLVIFRFEEKFYAQRGVPAKFVGHPLLDEMSITLSETDFRRRYGIPADKKMVALLPGSRKNEVEKLFPLMMQVVQNFPRELPVYWIVGKSAALPREMFDQHIPADAPLQVVEDDTHHVMKHATAALVASGTATLELAYFATPMVVLYRVSPLTYWIGKRLVKIPHIALANIVSGQQVVPELIQHELKVENIQRELLRLLTNQEAYAETVEQLRKVRDILGSSGAARRAAGEIAQFLENVHSFI